MLRPMLNCRFWFFNFLVALCSVACCVALYEDQTGKFDWEKEFIGEVENAVYETSISVSKHLYVSTRTNVVACISTRTGLIVWRKILDTHEGKVVFLSHTKDGLLTVTTQGLARVWDSATGILRWDADLSSSSERDDETFSIIDAATLEQSYSEGTLLVALSTVGLHSVSMLTSKRKPVVQMSPLELASLEPSENQIFVDSGNAKILHLQLQSGGRLLMSTYSVKDLEELTQVQIDTSWIDSLDMVALLEDGTLFYVSKEAGTVHLVDVERGKTKSSTSLSSLDVNSPVSAVIVNKHKDIRSHGLNVFLLHDDSKATLINIKDRDVIKILWTKSFPGLHSITVSQRSDQAYSFLSSATKTDVFVRAVNTKTGFLDDELTMKYRLPPHSGSLTNVFINLFLKRNTPVGFRPILTFTDHSIVLVSHPNKAIWQRDEALASVVDAAMLDLPLSDVDAGIEAEFEESGKTRIFEMFFKRVKAQGNMLGSWINQLLKDIKTDNLFRRKTRDPLIQTEGMTRDPFSLHKMIVFITECGALYGVDSLTGDIVWRYFSENLRQRKLSFYIQRTTAHFPHPPQAVLLAVDQKQERPLVTLTINPITGGVTDELKLFSNVNTSMLQVVLSPIPDSQYIRPLIVLDSELKLHFIPDSAEVREIVNEEKLFIYDISVDTGLIRGFTVTHSSSVQPVWSVQIVKSHRLVGFAAKQPFEKVDSQGRPLADRSVIYKYLNPNLFAVLSESLDDNVDRSSLILHVIDAVTGEIVHTVLHKKSSGPVHMVHSENWLLYSYWNTKARRTEISSLEFYEGKKQFNDTAFSSFHPRPNPIALQQTYMFPAGINSIGVTRTEKGLTSRQILFGLSRGSVFGMPRRYFDPRRPLTLTERHREEGLVPYMPEIPVPPELFLSYNLTVEKISSIYTVPAALESTSLILVTGLDIFFTRSQPSKMFDVLKEDFDHLFITAVLILMFVGALVTRRMSQVKQLKKSWR